MNLKIAICDDDASQHEYIESIVAEWARRGRHIADIRQYDSAKRFLFDYEAEKDFDILLLDIEMPEISGIEVAKRVRLYNTAAQIIFVTGYYEYFSDGFDVSALHYLIKPVDDARLRPVLDKAVENLSWRQRSVLVSTPDEDIKLPLADICYIEADNIYLNIYTPHGCWRTRSSLAKFSEQLDETFIKVHRSYIVSLKYIRKISRAEVTMTNGAAIPISRGMYNEVHAALIKYL